jgi:hypothetical protein
MNAEMVCLSVNCSHCNETICLPNEHDGVQLSKNTIVMVFCDSECQEAYQDENLT